MDDALEAINKWVDQGYIVDEKKIMALTMYLTEGPGKLQPQEYCTEQPKPTLMASAAEWWKQNRAEWKQQKLEFEKEFQRRKLEFEKEFQRRKLEFEKEFQRRKLEFEKELLELKKGKLEFEKEFQRRKLEFEKELLELKKGKFELELDKKRMEKEEEERRRIETVIKNAHTISDMEKFSDSEAADFNKLVLDKWNPLHQLLRGNTDLHAIRWRSFLPKQLVASEFHRSQTTFGGRYVLDKLNQEGIQKGWDQIKRDVCADYKGRGFEHLQVSYLEATEPDQLGKSMYACDETYAKVRVKHYAAYGVCFAALLESIFRVLDKDKGLPTISLKVLAPVHTSNGKLEVEVERSSLRCKFLIEMKNLKRQGDDIQEETRAKKNRVLLSDQKSNESEENKTISKKKQPIVLSDNNQSEPLQKARGQIGEVHVERQFQQVQSGFVNGVHVTIVRRTYSTKSEDHFNASRVLKILESSDIKIGEARSLDMDSRGVDQVLKELVIALIKAGFLPQSLLQCDVSGAAGLRAERMEVSVDEEQLVQPVKAEVAEVEHRYLFPVTIHGSGLKAWIKAATVGDRYKQVQRELLIRQYLCPEDSVKARAVVWRGVPALLLEDAGQKINTDRMTPEDVFNMTKAIYMVLSHVYGEHGILHNDVAPRNICQDEKGCYRLIDWGLASRLPDIDHPTNIPDWLYSGT
ncbi:calponin homology domain-containing protein DDB_G0272472 [Selaginella moellendorffii]|uniref:calponin homology domain-containing protein DDB_G0272472 n=1 Tax=Selaginella moellendorffii TaxID=88036 RepID=UPI000D1C33A1|nr:calponin homology domain-containing protein DDB_G0272472 [Selaginella moellendorffii]|eukprot:XP_024539018.1 calponin homology domain-containing protein DDB_G0272472 [Selaginella moellendorffii]